MSELPGRRDASLRRADSRRAADPGGIGEPLVPAKLMGIVNVTPDSFSDGGEFLAPEKAIGHGRERIAEGADVLDGGGESTRPGAEGVDAAEELRRVEPVIEGLASKGPPISVDTSKAVVAEAALGAGAAMVNDV